MSKIFEALERTRRPPDVRAVWSDHRPLVASLGETRPTGVSATSRGVNMQQEMIRLHQNLEALLPNHGHLLIQFMGSRIGEGTSTVAQEFARVSATYFGQRTLLLETDAHSPGSRPRGEGRDVDVIRVPSQVGDATFFTATIPRPSSSQPSTEGDGSATLWERLRREYDLVLIDSPPPSSAPGSLAVSRRVDGVLLVLEADTTRQQLVASVAEDIQRNGGRVLGIIFNKRRHHIPPFIYNRL